MHLQQQMLSLLQQQPREHLKEQPKPKQSSQQQPKEQFKEQITMQKLSNQQLNGQPKESQPRPQARSKDEVLVPQAKPKEQPRVQSKQPQSNLITNQTKTNVTKKVIIAEVEAAGGPTYKNRWRQQFESCPRSCGGGEYVLKNT
jgi:hypothetical protein